MLNCRNLLPAVVLAASTASVAHAVVIPIQDATFSRPIVSLAEQASPILDGTGWTTRGPASSTVEFSPGYFVNIDTIVWQNPTDYRRVDNLVPDYSVTLEQMQAMGDGANYPYQGCASIAANTGNEFSQILSTSFQAEQAYSLTVGVGHNYGTADQVPAASAYLTIALYYVDGASQRHIVASKDIYNDAATALSANHLNDFTADSNLLAASDPAIGQPIGLLLTSTGPAGGFFNVSNVRLTAVPEPASLAVLLGAPALLLARRRSVRC